MDDLRDTPQGQTALDMTRRLDPAAVAMVEGILLGDLDAARIGGWAWGVLGHTVDPSEGLQKLAYAVGEVTHKRPKKKFREEELDVPLDDASLAPINAAQHAVARNESERGKLPAHRAAVVEAQWATLAGQAAKKKAKL